jgi:hypothetical protein
LGHSVLRRGARDNLSRRLRGQNYFGFVSVGYLARESPRKHWVRTDAIGEGFALEEPNAGTVAYRAAAALLFSSGCVLAGESRGIAAINRWVYSCCGLAKIWPAVPHSTISP